MRAADDGARHRTDHLERDGRRDRRSRSILEGARLRRLARTGAETDLNGDRTILGKIFKAGQSLSARPVRPGGLGRAGEAEDLGALYVLNWFFGPENAVMLQTVSRLLPELPLFLLTAVATHLVMSFAQTLMHYKLGHRPMGGKFFRNHINFHHTYYSKDHLVSRTYLGDEGNNTPFFFIPVFLVGACTYLLLPFDLFVVQVVACAASFYAHVFFDKEYHVEGSRLQRFAWFRRKQQLHFVHHRHANCNFAVIHFFWDRILCTYRRPDGDISCLKRSQEKF